MKFFLCVALLQALSCSQVEKKKEPVPVRYTSTDIQECQNYQKNVLDKSYKEVKVNNAIVLAFTNDQAEARKSFAEFDINKGLTKIKAGLVTNILNSCDDESVKKFDQEYKGLAGCNLMFSELNYFQSLASGLNKYPWPTDLRLEGKKIAVDYVRYFSEGQFPLLNRLVALSVLDELSINQIVNKELHSEIKVLMEESRIYVEGLRQKLNKDPGLTCDSLDVIQEELIYSDSVAKKMQGFLKQI